MVPSRLNRIRCSARDQRSCPYSNLRSWVKSMSNNCVWRLFSVEALVRFVNIRVCHWIAIWYSHPWYLSRNQQSQGWNVQGFLSERKFAQAVSLNSCSVNSGILRQWVGHCSSCCCWQVESSLPRDNKMLDLYLALSFPIGKIPFWEVYCHVAIVTWFEDSNLFKKCQELAR